MSKPNIMIIFWGNPLYDGRCVNMINQLLRENLIVKVLGVDSKNDTLNFNGAEIQLINKNDLSNSFVKYFKFFKIVKKMILKEKPNTIIASDLYSLIPSAQIKKQKKINLIYDSREIYTKLAGLINRPIVQKIWSWYEKKYINYSDYVIANADIDKDYLKNLYPNTNIKILKNLPGEVFLKSTKINLRKLLCINDQTKILLYQGKLHNGRGIRFTLKCLKKLNDVAFVIIGDGPMKDAYIKTAEKEGVADKIYFIDSVPYEELGSFSNSADIGLSLIQPISKSYENALPNKLFEYAVSGLPVICSNLSAMKEMIDKYNCGIAISPKDTQAFSSAVDTIISNNKKFKINDDIKKELLWMNKNQQLIEMVK